MDFYIGLVMGALMVGVPSWAAISFRDKQIKLLQEIVNEDADLILKLKQPRIV